MFQRILVATDGSATAAQAEAQGARFARQHRSQLVGLYAHVPDIDGATSAERGRAALATFLTRWADLDPTTHIVVGDVAPSVGAFVSEHAIDLAVIGNVGLGERSRAGLDVPRALAADAPTDVLLVHTRGGDRGVPQRYGRIIVGVEATHRSFVAIRRAAVTARGDDAVLLLVHVGDDDEVLARATELAAEEDVEFDTHQVQGEPAEVLTSLPGDDSRCLLVIGNSGIDDATVDDTSVPARVLNRATCDVLLVKTV